MQAKREKQFDALELMEINALMLRRAYHDRKKLRAGDLFKRPKEVQKPVNKRDLAKERQEAQQYLAQFDAFNFADKEGGAQNGND